jgi:hypothetical protein
MDRKTFSKRGESEMRDFAFSLAMNGVGTVVCCRSVSVKYPDKTLASQIRKTPFTLTYFGMLL